tara:strand:- start:2654 stop:3316 length:663 start_codon:yes stop_codon:yes gene_type:complete
MGNREAATKEILKWVEELLPGGGNKEIYEKALAKMTNAQFDDYMKKLESGEEVLSLTVPNLSKKRLSVERNLKVAKKLGHNFFQRLWLTDPHSGTTYLTPITYLVVDLPLRRQAQLLTKKISIPESSDTADVLTGQATGPSKGASLSFPELQTLHAQGLEKTIEELIKFRGGDEEAYRAMNKELIDKGSVSLDSIQTNSRVKSTETLSTFLKAAHIQNNL